MRLLRDYQTMSRHNYKVQGPDAPLNELDGNGCTPLMYAAAADSVLAIEILLSYSAKREQVCARLVMFP